MSTTHKQYSEYKQYQDPEYKIVNDQVVRFSDICVHEFTMGDVEDPDLYAAQPIWEWQESEAGKFVMEHAVEAPYWISQMDVANYSQVYRVMARLSEQNETFWRLLCSNKQ